MKTQWTFTEKRDENGWRKKVKNLHPKAECRSVGAGQVVASTPDRKTVGHFKPWYGGFVLRKGAKSNGNR
jgi:hypothetical protein